MLTQYVVYDHPADYPESFVVRAWRIVRGHSEPVPAELPLVLAATLDAARAAIPDGLICLGRFPHDDPKIVEVWT